MRLFLVYFVILNISFSISAMAEKPYHHVYENGKFKKFRNYQGAPERNKNFKWSYKKFREAKKNINVIIYDMPFLYIETHGVTSWIYSTDS